MRPLKRGPTPYYHQIGAILREKIENGELSEGERVPSEEELCRAFKVSRATVRQALQNLEHDDLIIREPGRGSFVNRAPDKVAHLKMTCLLEDLIALGIPAETQVMETGMVRSSGAVAEALGLEAGDEVFSFLRVISVEKQAFAVTRVYLPAWMGAKLTKKDLEAQHLLNTLAKKCDVHGETADQLVEAVMADASQSNLLDVNAGTPLLSVSRTTFNPKGECIEFSVTHYRSDRTRFYISQKQRRAGSNWVLSARGGRSARRSLKHNETSNKLVRKKMDAGMKENP